MTLETDRWMLQQRVEELERQLVASEKERKQLRRVIGPGHACSLLARRLVDAGVRVRTLETGMKKLNQPALGYQSPDDWQDLP